MTEDTVRYAVLEERVENVIKNQETYAKEAREWRDRFCKKLDVLIEKESDRPCAVHETKLKSIGTLWNVVWFTIAGVISLAVVWGGLLQTVENHSKVIEKLTETSYGYRGVKVVTEHVSTAGAVKNSL